MSSFSGFSQVGIGTNTPQSTLDVVGNTRVDGSLFLENPGRKSEIRNSKLLILSTANTVLKYDIQTSKYGPINYIELAFRNIASEGLLDYDTKISTNDYIATIQGYYFLEPTTGDTDILLLSLTDTSNIEGYQIYAYANPITQTWFLRAKVNNSIFMTRNSSSVFIPTQFDLFLNLVVYRKGFITKEHEDVSVNMGNSELFTAPLPAGF